MVAPLGHILSPPLTHKREHCGPVTEVSGLSRFAVQMRQMPQVYLGLLDPIPRGRIMFPREPVDKATSISQYSSKTR